MNAFIKHAAEEAGRVLNELKLKGDNMAKKHDHKEEAAAPAPAAPVEQVKIEVNKGEDLVKQEDLKEGVPNQEPPTKGVTARLDMDPAEVADPK